VAVNFGEYLHLPIHTVFSFEHWVVVVNVVQGVELDGVHLFVNDADALVQETVLLLSDEPVEAVFVPQESVFEVYAFSSERDASNGLRFVGFL
jgi:hypothetical protein